MPLVHIDTGHLPETMQFRDDLVKELGVQLIVGSVQDLIDRGEVTEESGFNASRNHIQTRPLSAPLSSTSSTRVSAEPGATRKRRAPRSASSATETTSATDPEPAPGAVGPVQQQAPAR